MKFLAISVLLTTVAFCNGDEPLPLADLQSVVKRVMGLQPDTNTDMGALNDALKNVSDALGSLPTTMDLTSALGTGLNTGNVVDILLTSVPLIFNALRKTFFQNLRLSQVGEVFKGIAAAIWNKPQNTFLAKLLASIYFVIGFVLSFFGAVHL